MYYIILYNIFSLIMKQVSDTSDFEHSLLRLVTFKANEKKNGEVSCVKALEGGGGGS